MEQQLILELKQAAERYMQALEFVKNRDNTVLERDVTLINTVLHDFHRVANPHAVLALCSATSGVLELRQKLADARHQICDLNDILAASPPLQLNTARQQEAP